MKQNFTTGLKHVLMHEGGFSKHPSDPGGATMKGITLAVFQQNYGADATEQQLKNISDEQLQHIYKTQYWDKCHCDDLPSGLDYCVFDGAVNSGPRRSAKWLQGAVGAVQDGGIGPLTLAKVGEKNPLQIIEDVCSQRLHFLQGLSTWPVFGQGWGRRVDEVREKASALSQGLDLEVAQVTAPQDFAVVRLGVRGPWVSRLQAKLGIDADGIFGKGTEKALKQWQSAHGLQADGIAGRNTYQAMGLL